jgi:hypothetical protein
MRRRIQALAILALGAMGWPGSAGSQCNVFSLVSGTAQTATATPQNLSFNQTANFWTAVGVRSGASSNWNLAVYQATAAFPTCVSGSLAASSAVSGVDFVVGDFNSGHDVLGFYYPQVTRLSGSTDGTVEWDSGSNSLTVNGPIVNRTTGPTDVLEVWDVSLLAGHDYRFTFTRTGANVKMLLFQSGAGAYWAARSARLIEITASTTYTPASSGFFGVVVVNDDGVSGSYTLGVGECRTPDVLTSGVSVSSSGLAERTYVCSQEATFFTALGARGASDWNLESYSDPTAGTYPTCLSSQLAASALAAPSVDFVVGDYTSTVPEPFYARVHLNQDQGSGSARVEWDSGADFIEVNGAAIDRNTDANDVLEVWDTFLTSGQTYNILFNTTGANLRLFLFKPGQTWVGRSTALLNRAGAATHQPYVAANTGWHGVVVVNEDGGTGSYHLRINQGVVGVNDPQAPVANALQGIAPNPARGPARFDFALREASRVSFQVLDVAGRVVSETPERSWQSGRWSMSWDGRARNGSRLAPGVYFVRMQVAGQPLALKKLALLN